MENMALLRSFEDILEPRRQEISNFLWVSRELSRKVPHKQIRKIDPEEIKLEVLNSAKIQSLIENEVAKGFLSDKLVSKIKDILDEIGYNRKLQIIRWLGLVLAKICVQVCSGIHVNQYSILKLRNEMGNVPVMYVPSHRSYADFILMSYVCFHYDIEIPAIAAGMDFHGMWGMGNVLRNTGAFFMRRSYNDDSVYWDTFREYVHQLVIKSDLGIEFFIEGTRSRSGKSLFPKFGLFSMILKAFFNGEVPDILFVPINISYERIMEEKLFAFELLGVPKPKESTSAFFKSLSLINERYGNVYVNFGNPISTYQYFGDRIDRSKHSTKPLHMQTMTDKEKEVMSLLAQSIVKEQQKLCTITTFNLMSIVIVEVMIYRNSKLTVETLMKELNWFKTIIEKFGAVTNFNGTVASILELLLVHHDLLRLCDDGSIELVKSTEEETRIDRTKLKGHQFHNQIMTESVPLIMIQLYVNPTLHYFINSSLIVTVLRKLDQGDGISKDALFAEYSFLRSVFIREFVLFPMYEQMEFEDSLKSLQNTQVIKNFNLLYLDSNEQLRNLLCNLFQPFLLTYYIVCSILTDVDAYECSEGYIVCNTQAELEKLINTRKSIHPYTLNLDTITNCLQSLLDLKAVQKIKRSTSVNYMVQNQILPMITEKLDHYMVCLVPGFKITPAAKL